MIGLRLVPRARPSGRMVYGAPLLAVLATLLIGLGIFALLGHPALTVFHVLFIEPISDINGLSELLLKASPLCLIALGLSVGFRAGIWNIGAEGQMYIGGVFATGLAIAFHERGGWWLLPAMILAGALGGALWASITALLRTRFRTNEILVSLMLTYVANLIVKYLVFGPWQDPASNHFPLTVAFSEDALFSVFAESGWEWLEGTRLNTSIFITVLAVPLAWLFMKRSFAGYQLSVAGLAPRAAAYAGFPETKLVWMALLVGGAAAGLAGVSELAGPLGQLNDRWTPGYGFAAIIVATLGRLEPLGIVLAALLMALLSIGGDSAQIALQLPAAISHVFEGILLMCLLGCEVLIAYRVEVTGRAVASAGRPS